MPQRGDTVKVGGAFGSAYDGCTGVVVTVKRDSVSIKIDAGPMIDLNRRYVMVVRP
ncbi:MAG: hypothetical protein GY901_11760 [Actinomycetia bacterium]|nr:hypothetical protein [Actinomycetes bacterium]